MASHSNIQAEPISHQGRAGSLIDRLVAEDEGGLPQPSVREYGYVRSIQRNLENILNARAGTSAARPDYGLSDFNDGAVLSSDMLRFIREDIRHAIQEFEPRLGNVSIEGGQIGDGIPHLRFRLLCEVNTPDGHDKVAFTLALEDGQVKVRQ